MKTVCEKDKCDGCMACLNVCSKHAIKVHDSMKAYNAIIDENSCINCGACQRICQRRQSVAPLTKPIYWKEGWAEDETLRKESSSGGFAAAIEQAFIESGGIVCSCAFLHGEFSFVFAETKEQTQCFKGSKYVKSNPKEVYPKISNYLKDGRNLLFVGLPCQVAAVKNYIGDNEKLFTVDLICHGTPSSQILELFLNNYNCSLKQLRDISFRTKTIFGLKQLQKRFTVPTVQDSYTIAFLHSLSYTENCYDCKYASLNRISDITLGDSWGSNLSSDIQEKGVSLALCQTEKGQKLLEQSNLYLLDVSLEQAVNNNHQLRHPSIKPKQRDYFFKQIERGKNFNWTIFRCYPKRYIKNIIKTIIYKYTPPCI